VTQPTRHPQEPDLTPEQIAERIALVRAAKEATCDNLTSADLDMVLSPDGAETARQSWEKKNRARAADQKRAWRARNQDKVAGYVLARKVARLGKQAAKSVK
jgi:hypothetical protein